MEVTTPHGSVTIVDPEPEKLQSLRSVLPFGVVDYRPEIKGAKYGIVMKCGEDEAWAVKQQPPEVPEENLKLAYLGNSILITLSIQKYMQHGFGGCLLPCPYFRRKPGGVEAGVAYFGSSSASGIEAEEFPFEGAFDNQFGHGFTTMFTHFVQALKTSSKESGIPLQPCIGLDYRPCSALETLGMQFLIHGTEIYCLKTRISEQDPIWTALRSTGIDLVTYLPSVPAEISPDQLAIAKPSNHGKPDRNKE